MNDGMTPVFFENLGGMKIGIDYMPYHKKPCLVVRHGCQEIKYASFNNDYAAKDFIEVMCKFLGIKDGERE